MRERVLREVAEIAGDMILRFFGGLFYHRFNNSLTLI